MGFSHDQYFLPLRCRRHGWGCDQKSYARKRRETLCSPLESDRAAMGRSRPCQKGVEVRAAFYLRRSTDKQEKSIGDQRAEVDALRVRRGYSFVCEYVDDAISGDATEKRHAFQRMIKDAAAKRFDVVLCWDQDRFGRFDALEAGYWIQPMRTAGVVLETVTQGRVDWNDFAGRLVYSITQEGKHAYLRDLAKNINRTVRRRAAEGVWCGKAPFGYVLGDDGRLVLGDPAAVAAVRRVFELRAQGIGYRSLGRLMNREGHPLPASAPWNMETVRSILAREHYTGRIIFGRLKTAKYEPRFNGPMRVDNAHPAIITEAMWSATRPELFRGNHAHRRNGEYSAALAGLLNCGRCSAPMYAFRYKGEIGYVCSSYHRGMGCGFCRVMDGQIRTTLSGVIQRRLDRFDLDDVREVLEAAVRDRRAAKGRPGESIATLDRKIRTASERILLVPKSGLEAARRSLLQMQAERDRLAGEVPQRSTASVADGMRMLAELPEILRSGAATLARECFTQVVSSVSLEFDVHQPGKTRRFFQWSHGVITLQDGSSEECVPCLRSPALWMAARTVLGGGRKTLRFAA